MFLQSTMIKRAAPLLISSASGIYVVLRARRLSLADPYECSMLRFLAEQSDLITVLAGVPVCWYASQRRPRGERSSRGILRGRAAHAMHALRQSFSALLLGTDLLARRASAEQPELSALAQRLNGVVRQAIADLNALGEPYAPDLDAIYSAKPPPEQGNGNSRAYGQ